MLGVLLGRSLLRTAHRPAPEPLHRASRHRARSGAGLDAQLHGPPWIAEMHDRLNEVERAEGPTGLVVTGSGKFFSNGVDLDDLSARMPAGGDEFFRQLFGLLARVLTFPVRTVAAVNGHAFGGGGLLSLCADVRVMREDRGWWCMPEAELGVPMHPCMLAILRARLPAGTAHEAVVTGRRYAGPDARAASIVEHVSPEEQVVPRAVALAAADATKDRAAQRDLKEGLYADLLGLLRDSPALFGES